MSENTEPNSLIERLEALEKRVGKAKVPKPTEPVTPLHELNRRSIELDRERRAEKRSAAGVAIDAIKTAFGTRPKNAKRVQKDLSGYRAEETAAATAKTKA